MLRGKLTLIPLWRLVKKKHEVISHAALEALGNELLFVFCFELELLAFLIDVGQQHFHASRSFRAEHICFVLDASVLFPYFVFVVGLFCSRALVVDVKFSAKKI